MIRIPTQGVMRLLVCAFFVTGAIRPIDVSAQDPRAIPLVDQRGQTFDLTDVRGRPAFLTFVATRCSDACPIANAAFANLARRLRHDRIAAQLITVTLDPLYDTPFVMARLARTFAAAPPYWTFASGSSTDVRRLMRSFGVRVEAGSGVPEAHSTFVYLLDGRMRLARTFLLTTAFDADAENALRALRSGRP